jgi:hypothetical protein
LLCKSTYSKGRKVVLGRMKRHVLMWSVKALTQKAEGGHGQDGETGVDLLSKSTNSKGRKMVLGRMERHVLKSTNSKGRKVVLGRMEKQVF